MPLNMTRILAIRHGETAWNVDTRIQGHLDIALNDTGRGQAARLARALAARGEPLAAVYSSDLQRAWDTARALAEATGAPLVPHTGLRERHFGRLQGLTYADIAARHPEDAQRWRMRDPHWVPEGGESLHALHQRVLQTVHALAAAHPGEQIAIVSHGGVLDSLYRAAVGIELSAPRTWKITNTAVHRFLRSGEALTLLAWGDTSHLDEADAVLDERAG
jgi:probable phosphoglycerate mutase